MRRMPDDRRLSTLIRAGAPVQDHLRDLARSVAAFHAAARRDPMSPRKAAVTRSRPMGGEHRTGTGAVRPAGTETVDAVDRLATRSPAAGRCSLMVRRWAIVDGHGDLIADDIFCLDDGPRALDCLEFDDTLRYLDGLTTWRSSPWTSSASAGPTSPTIGSTPTRVLRGPGSVALRHTTWPTALRPGQGRVPAPPAGRARGRDGRGAVRRPQPAAPRGGAGGSRWSGVCRHGQDHLGEARPTGSAPSCSPAMAAQGTRRPLPASPPLRPTAGPLHRRTHRRLYPELLHRAGAPKPGRVVVLDASGRTRGHRHST